MCHAEFWDVVRLSLCALPAGRRLAERIRANELRVWSCVMSREVAAEPGMSYEAVLEAVQESSRGRWFLNEFKLRNAGIDTRQILSAIARLEARMESLSGGGGGAAADLAKVRNAIATTRQDILKVSGAPGLSEEGKLFAHLAELARKSLAQGGTTPGSEALPGSIVQALRLVDQIDGALNTSPATAKMPETPYADNFFGRDRDLFDPQGTQSAQAAQAAPGAQATQAAPAKPMLVPSAAPPPAVSKPAVETPVLGARLVISRSKPPEPEEEAPAGEKPAAPQADASAPAHPRIVISRRKPDDMPAPEADTPLPTENAA
jgi:hypothetical protein